MPTIEWWVFIQSPMRNKTSGRFQTVGLCCARQACCHQSNKRQIVYETTWRRVFQLIEVTLQLGNVLSFGSLEAAVSTIPNLSAPTYRHLSPLSLKRAKPRSANCRLMYCKQRQCNEICCILLWLLSPEFRLSMSRWIRTWPPSIACLSWTMSLSERKHVFPYDFI
jgi:hypothetical protein